MAEKQFGGNVRTESNSIMHEKKVHKRNISITSTLKYKKSASLTRAVA